MPEPVFTVRVFIYYRNRRNPLYGIPWRLYLC